jgi:hypothetical protein
MTSKKKKNVFPPPPQSASNKDKAAYYEKHDPVDLIDAGLFEEDGIYKGNKRLVDLRPLGLDLSLRAQRSNLKRSQ